MPWEHRHLKYVSLAVEMSNFDAADCGCSARVERTGQFVQEPVRGRTQALLMLLRTTTHIDC
jgi:hypothetical protein